MQNSIDRQRLLRRFGQDPAHPAAVIAKCIAGFVILIGLLLIGLYAPEGSIGTHAQTAPARTANDKSADAAASQPRATPAASTRN